MIPTDRTEANLIGVDTSLVAVVRRALTTCPQPFVVFEGLRTLERQRALVSMGTSQTMASKHLIGDAVDLVPLVDGKPSWTWEHIYPIAEAMRQAAKDLPEHLGLRWGGCWNADFSGSTDPVETLVAEYAQRRKDAGQAAFLDGPHFELVERKP